ncbi:MAG: hypothetical protein EP330_03095 [Deltaproteobacteria bacterium]|nr:MAG: hypothetical protein EP330_03095 [Deltaproteobacteria bacterium]
MRGGLAIALLIAVTGLAAAVPALGPAVPWMRGAGAVFGWWTVAGMIATALAMRVLEPPRDNRVGTLSPVLGGVLSAALVCWRPTVMGAVFAVLPLAVSAHLRLSHALRRALADVPFELWEAAWLLGATRMQAVVHVAVPAARNLRPRLMRAGAECLVGLALALFALGWTA